MNNGPSAEQLWCYAVSRCEIAKGLTNPITPKSALIAPENTICSQNIGTSAARAQRIASNMWNNAASASLWFISEGNRINSWENKTVGSCPELSMICSLCRGVSNNGLLDFFLASRSHQLANITDIALWWAIQSKTFRQSELFALDLVQGNHNVVVLRALIFCERNNLIYQTNGSLVLCLNREGKAILARGCDRSPPLSKLFVWFTGQQSLPRIVLNFSPALTDSLWIAQVS